MPFSILRNLTISFMHN